MNNMKQEYNPYELPKQFQRLRTLLNRLSYEELPTCLRGGTVVSTDSSLFVSYGKRCWLVVDGSHVDIHGVIAGRFNTYVFKLLSALSVAYPALHNEIVRFRSWLDAEAARYDRTRAEQRLKQEADELGFDLVRKSI